MTHLETVIVSMADKHHIVIIGPSVAPIAPQEAVYQILLGWNEPFDPFMSHCSPVAGMIRLSHHRQPRRWFFTNSRKTRAALASSGRRVSSFLAR